MSSRSYRPPPGQQDPSRGPSSVRRSTYDAESDLFGSAPPPSRPAQRAPSMAPPARSGPSLPPPRAGSPSIAPAAIGRSSVSPAPLGGRMIDDAPPPSFSKGARDENSVLFSVKDLVNAAAARKSAAPPPGPSPTAHNPFGNDPTGLVDLHAMAHDTHSSLEVKQLDIANLRPSVVPMPIQQASSWGGGTEENPSGFDKLVALAKGPRAPLLFAGIGVVALLFVGFGAMLTAWALSDSGGDLSAAIAAPTAPAEDGVIEREVVQRTKVAEAPSAGDAPTASTGGSARRHGTASHGTSYKPSSSSKASSSTSSKPKKASDPCNCHGQLACAMRCTK